MGAMRQRAGVVPFSALVGQDAMKRALLLNAVNPAIGGVLIRGQKGTAKSTVTRVRRHFSAMSAGRAPTPVRPCTARHAA
jgi:hypothetical protein